MSDTGKLEELGDSNTPKEVYKKYHTDLLKLTSDPDLQKPGDNNVSSPDAGTGQLYPDTDKLGPTNVLPCTDELVRTNKLQELENPRKRKMDEVDRKEYERNEQFLSNIKKLMFFASEAKNGIEEYNRMLIEQDQKDQQGKITD
jgi:hypothetical protein